MILIYILILWTFEHLPSIVSIWRLEVWILDSHPPCQASDRWSFLMGDNLQMILSGTYWIMKYIILYNNGYLNKLIFA